MIDADHRPSRRFIFADFFEDFFEDHWKTHFRMHDMLNEAWGRGQDIEAFHLSADLAGYHEWRAHEPTMVRIDDTAFGRSHIPISVDDGLPPNSVYAVMKS